MVDRKQAGDADRPLFGGLVTALVSACAALGVVAVVWALYASLDEQGFALDRSVLRPVSAWIAGTSAPATPAAAAASWASGTGGVAGTVVARQHGSTPRQP